MKKLLSTLLHALEDGRDAVLCTILASSGSSPRGAGSKMLVLENGETAGTIGGGAVEQRAAQQALEVLRTHKPHVRGYCLAPNEVEDIGMICGGNVTVYFQLFEHENGQAKEALCAALALLDGEQNAWLVSRIAEGALAKTGVYDEAHGLRFMDGLSMDELAPLLKTRAVYTKGEPAWYVEPLLRAGRVYLFGGGHVGQALVPVLGKLDFRVVVFDNRERVARPEAFPMAERVILGDYRRFGDLLTVTRDDSVVIMTPGHQADYEVLRQALRTPAGYVGCIGSRHKVAATREKLLAEGFTEEDIRRVHSPIGLPIGAETPEEIAISVAAELIAHRASLR